MEDTLHFRLENAKINLLIKSSLFISGGVSIAKSIGRHNGFIAERLTFRSE